ncbi:sugar kinase [Sinirhodobacter populi]|uniref:Sugar kinase n=1 Tax=Paenirhodobacter populi TaxID=2306993 RepID=A0A443JZK5_9RHOB|nr:BadF/BadG/BcrA/BcrD ATPase family protein [Sinirhodobacter populi]RWR25914.1 sugar kinase [Sinirhodobacter populi]
MMTKLPQLCVGIDIGGTKTQLRAVRADDGGIVADTVVSTSGWRRREWNADAATLLDMVSGLVAPSGGETAAIAIGAHGCDDADECEAFQSAFARLSRYPIRVVNDAELMPLAVGLGNQIGIVSGTGSIGVCRSPQRGMLVAGGWGWIVGDDGSAPALVREAVRAVGLHFDRGGSRRGDPLVEAMFDTMGVISIPRLGSVISSLGSAAAVGEYAIMVFDAAAAGSALARRVIDEGGRALAQLAIHLNDRGAGASHAIAGGSVIAAQPMLWDAFSDAIAELGAGAIEPHLFSGKPVAGACLLARSILAEARGGTSSVSENPTAFRTSIQE